MAIGSKSRLISVCEEHSVVLFNEAMEWHIQGSKSDRNIKHGLAGEAMQSPWCLPALLNTDAQCSQAHIHEACTVNSVLRTALLWLSDFPSIFLCC